MPNRNKQRGDRAEVAVKNYFQSLGFESKRTRAGFDSDLGDIIATTPRGLLCVQVKDCAKAEWGKWFTQLNDQIATLKANTTKPVVGGILVWKMRGTSNPANWRAICQLEQLPRLLGEY